MHGSDGDADFAGDLADGLAVDVSAEDDPAGGTPPVGRLNKAADAAQVVRREQITILLTHKTPPKGAAKLTAQVIANSIAGRPISEGGSLARDLLGGEFTKTWSLTSIIDKASDSCAQVISLAHVIATFEEAYSRSAWRDCPDTIKPYLDFLVPTGYTPPWWRLSSPASAPPPKLTTRSPRRTNHPLITRQARAGLARWSGGAAAPTQPTAGRGPTPRPR
ncbi:hypothetical protein [Corynebacterium sp.]|uniref:hypothetical protein n=1 Tax=Corynebacterium sp. TaxID=1720 RepID=UPI0028B15B44|nr:hypothetical protein [Corynebacterium sp.]